MASMRDIKRRRESITSTSQITKAMKLVSTVKLQKAKGRADESKPYFEKIGVKCPECGGEIVLKRTRKGRRYFGCENNPACGFMSWTKPVEKRCPECGSYMTEKGNKLVCSDESCGHSENADRSDTE
jgi:ssDNA-binding Zn-finger/Zn-ribbon topoisomerase 1